MAVNGRSFHWRRRPVCSWAVQPVTKVFAFDDRALAPRWKRSVHSWTGYAHSMYREASEHLIFSMRRDYQLGRSITLRATMCFRMQVGPLCVLSIIFRHAYHKWLWHPILYNYRGPVQCRVSWNSKGSAWGVTKTKMRHTRDHELLIPVAAQTPSVKTLYHMVVLTAINKRKHTHRHTPAAAARVGRRLPQPTLTHNTT